MRFKTKEQKATFIAIAILLGIFLWNLAGYKINKYYHAKMQSYPKMYCYQQYWGPVNQVLFVKKKQDIDSLVSYYRKIEKTGGNPTFDFPLAVLPRDTCVYIVGYEKDSTAAKIICYYDFEAQGDFVKGYVYVGTLHKSPPPKYK